MRNNAIKLLTEKKLRPSVQRVEILAYLLDKKNHPTVDMIYSDLHPSFPTLSKTTVYNTLRLLESEKLIQTIGIEETELRYDADISNHLHFKCLHCKNVYDIFSISPQPIDSLLPKGFLLTKTQINLWGICEKCNSQ
ncbi:MAG: transcriptional repressor [Spirochaetaceae bacterium]|nr:transcriptional repressor [Spirochaetaceae bacterium]